MSAPKVTDRVRFAPNPGMPSKIHEGEVVRHRSGQYRSGAARMAPTGNAGWLDVLCDDGVTRSVRPRRAEVLPPEKCPHCDGPAWVKHTGSVMPGIGVPCPCVEDAQEVCACPASEYIRDNCPVHGFGVADEGGES